MLVLLGIAPWTKAETPVITKVKIDQGNPVEVAGFIFQMANSYGVDPFEAQYIVEHESGYDPSMVGDDKLICRKTGKMQRSRGVFQISDCYHPEVSDACAFDLECSTIWSLKWIKAGHANQWTTWRKRKK